MLASDLHRHDWRTPGLQGIQCRPRGGGLPVQADSCHPHSHLLGLCRSRPVVPWCHHGLPEEVISDCGPTFMSNFLRELAALLGVQLTPSTSYHPQTDGQLECMNQEIEAYLRVFVSH